MHVPAEQISDGVQRRIQISGFWRKLIRDLKHHYLPGYSAIAAPVIK
jgi:hypothetical protein